MFTRAIVEVGPAALTATTGHERSGFVAVRGHPTIHRRPISLELSSTSRSPGIASSPDGSNGIGRPVAGSRTGDPNLLRSWLAFTGLQFDILDHDALRMTFARIESPRSNVSGDVFPKLSRRRFDARTSSAKSGSPGMKATPASSADGKRSRSRSGRSDSIHFTATAKRSNR